MDDVFNARKVGDTKSLTQLLCRMSNYHSMRPKRNSNRHDPPPVTGSLRVSGAHPLVSPSVTGQRPRERSLRPAGPQKGRHLVPLPRRHSEGSPRLRPGPKSLLDPGREASLPHTQTPFATTVMPDWPA